MKRFWRWVHIWKTPFFFLTLLCFLYDFIFLCQAAVKHTVMPMRQSLFPLLAFLLSNIALGYPLFYALMTALIGFNTVNARSGERHDIRFLSRVMLIYLGFVVWYMFVYLAHGQIANLFYLDFPKTLHSFSFWGE